MKRLPKIPLLELFACATLIIVFCELIASLPKGPTPAPNVAAQTHDVPYQAKVIAISDGDSLTVRVNNETIKIRLAQIDAPESGQPWGQRSQQALGRLVGGKTVTVTPHDIDRYGRTIGDIKVGSTDVNQAMVARGAAWAYVDYARDDTMATLESRARSSGQGLWALTENQRIAPWEYRRQRRDNRVTTTAR